MRVLSFLAVTVLGIVAAYGLASTRLSPLGWLISPAALFWIYRTMRRRLDGNDETGSRRVFPPENGADGIRRLLSPAGKPRQTTARRQPLTSRATRPPRANR